MEVRPACRRGGQGGPEVLQENHPYGRGLIFAGILIFSHLASDSFRLHRESDGVRRGSRSRGGGRENTSWQASLVKGAHPSQIISVLVPCDRGGLEEEVLSSG